MGRGLVERGLNGDSAVELEAMSKEQTFRSEDTQPREFIQCIQVV